MNGESIYSTVPWLAQNDTVSGNVWYTAGMDGAVFATVLGPPVDHVDLGSVAGHVTNKTVVHVLGHGGQGGLSWAVQGGGVVRVQTGTVKLTANVGVGFVLKFVHLKKSP